MKLSIQDDDFLNALENLGSYPIGEQNKNLLNVFIVKINANEFNVSYMQELLLDPMIDFSLSRRVREGYKNKPGILSKRARSKFVEYYSNKGELGELLLYCFLEAHLKAPKILSKLELKTSNNMNVHGSDGVHFLKLENGGFQLIFGESKTVKDFTAALSEAFRSIHEFKLGVNSKGNDKSGLPYEKVLISDHLLKETFSDEEKAFIKQIVYPTKETGFETDDAFGMFIGYEVRIDAEERCLGNDEFRSLIRERVKADVKSRLEHIQKKIGEYRLYGHSFYLYILPFSELDETRSKLMEGLLK